MTSKHTPGPWIFYKASSSDRGENYGIKASPPNYWVIPPLNISPADARLIAAAPEMLELHKKHMKLMIEIAQELKNPRMPIGQTVEASIRMLALAAKESLDAIAKATGETQ